MSKREIPIPVIEQPVWQTHADILRWRAVHQPELLAYSFLSDGETEDASLTNRELDRLARRIAGYLQQIGASGERVLLLYPQGLEYVSAFFACLYAGAVAVPAYPPSSPRSFHRIRAIVEDAQAKVVLTTTQILTKLRRSPELLASLQEVQWITTDTIADEFEHHWSNPGMRADDLAFLQYTSGSTGTPKGVMVSYGNLIQNNQTQEAAMRHPEGAPLVSWLPLFHDMGLIGSMLYAMYRGGACILMPPSAFIQKPYRWLRAISRYKAHTSGAPNFAYDLCVQRISPEQRATLDLSHWKVAFCGAEPIHAQTQRNFIQTFAECGFQEQSFWPCYGLAESTLFVSGNVKQHLPLIITVQKQALEQNQILAASEHTENISLVGCGSTHEGQRAVIVDPEALTLCPAGHIGEIWLAGPSVTQGYWQRPEETQKTFQAFLHDRSDGPFLRTGDLGFLHHDQLFITGRIKDVIIIHGRNLYPHDIERTTELAHSALRHAGGAAFSVPIAHEERLVVVQEIGRHYQKQDLENIFAAIRQAVSEEHEAAVHTIVLIKAATLPKTSSGKVQRRACRQSFFDQSLDVVAQWVEPEQTSSNHQFIGAHPSRSQYTLQEIRAWLVNALSLSQGIERQRIDIHAPLAQYGLGSLATVRLAGDLQQWLGYPLSPTLAYEYPSIEQLAQYLSQGALSAPVGQAHSTHASLDEPIAVIGMNCRFPGASHLEAFWQMLCDGKEAMSEIPADRWNAQSFYDPDPLSPGKMYTRFGGFLENIYGFDAKFFGISPHEARQMDPQQRLLLEVAWETFENAGLAVDKLAGSLTGVFIGMFHSSEYAHLQTRSGDRSALDDPHYGIGSSASVAAGRLAYFFDFRGPTMTIDTACSSSLVAMHLASQSLRNRECHLAFVGGVNLILSPDSMINACKMHMLSADGRCKTFDISADGYAMGEGCGGVLLERLEDAQANHHPILAIIRGSAVNQDGRSNGLTAPNKQAQKAVIRQALDNAGLEPYRISYVEAHGPGTALGDPIEVEALATVLGESRSPEQPVMIGSVKTNIGHLVGAAGIAGFIKTVLALQHQQIPAHLHLQTPTSHIPWSQFPVTVPTALTPWPDEQRPRVAGVSSFGWSGTNVHLILEEAEPTATTFASTPYHLLILSAKTPTALETASQQLISYLRTHREASPADIAYTYQIGRTSFGHRLMLVYREIEDALTALETQDTQQVLKQFCGTDPRPIAFVFPGVGEQYPGMTRELYQHEPFFRQIVEECCTYLKLHQNLDLLPLLGLDSASPSSLASTGQQNGLDLRALLGRSTQEAQTGNPLRSTELAQPTVFVLEYALARLLLHWGIVPQALMGYSLGEYVAACISGVLSLHDALRLVVQRARLISQLPAGCMTAVLLSEQEVQPYLSDQIFLAAVNAPQTCVLAGSPPAITQLEQRLSRDGIVTRRVNATHAFHTPLLEPVGDELRQSLSTLILKEPQIPYVSNVTGTWVTAAQATDQEYWVRHMCEPVRWQEGVGTLLQGSEQIILEVGVGQTLGSFIKQHELCSKEQMALTFSLLPEQQEKESEQQRLMSTLGKLWLSGTQITWERLAEHEQRRRVLLPTYPFERELYRIDLPPQQPSTQSVQTSKEKKTDIGEWFYRRIWQQKAQEQHPVSPSALQKHGPYLVFLDSLTLGQQLVERLTQQGQHVFAVQPAEHFSQLNKHTFGLQPQSSSDYTALFRQLRNMGALPKTLVYGWAIQPSLDDDHFQSYLQDSIYSLLHLVRALAQASNDEDIQLILLSDQGQQVTGQEEYHPSQALLPSIATVITQEYLNIACRCVDLDLRTPSAVQQLLQTLVFPADTLIAYRDGQRWLPYFDPLYLGPISSSPLRMHGVYLITGGLGYIGLALASYLATHLQARLILLARTSFPPTEQWDLWLQTHDSTDPTCQKILRLQQIQQAGAQILLAQADVADEHAMTSVLHQIDQRFGTLHAVFHAAGVTSEQAFRPIKDIGEHHWQWHLLPKVHGLLTLQKALQGRTLDFCVLFSSISTILGGLGFVAYAAANAFMDAMSARFNEHSPFPWICINWDTWQLQPEMWQGIGLGQTVSVYAMQPEEGIEALLRILAAKAETQHVLVSTGEIQPRIDQWVKMTSIQQPEETHNTVRPSSASSHMPMKEAYEHTIAQIWQQVLGMSEIGLDDNFFDLGGNSLLGLQVVAKIKKAFQVQVSAVTLFEAPTVRAMTKYLLPKEEVAEHQRIRDLALRRQKARRAVDQQGIAIIGMAGRFPGASTLEQFWQNLRNGVESITFFSDEELLAAGVDPTLLSQPNYIKAKPILDQVDQFDAAFFGYSPREAELMDPQHRLFLESCWQALETAGYDPLTYPGSIGVFAGSNISTYLHFLMTQTDTLRAVDDYQIVMGNDKDSLTTSVSYKLNLKGPSFSIQTFCSTSLVATHLACQSLFNGECDMALSGGVSVRVPAHAGYLYSEGGMESPDGHCRTFDAQAQGTLFGDGVGVVVLKRLEDALTDGDPICAVIKGSAINNDGSLKVSYTAPSVIGQTEVVTNALATAGVDATSIDYVEAHGTATVLGDPIEVTSLTKAFRTQTDKVGFCALGSVKTNVGHLDRAAGICGLIKTVLALQNEALPPSLHYQSPNPEMDLEHSPFYVNTQLTSWTRGQTPRRAGINSLGMGGTNAHLILEEAPLPAPTSPGRPYQLLLLSARTASALQQQRLNLLAYLQQAQEVNLADIAYTLQVGRHRFEHRLMLVCRDQAQAITLLEQEDPAQIQQHVDPRSDRSLVFVFPGVGEQYPGMTQELYQQEPFFRQIVEECCTHLKLHQNLDLLPLLGLDSASPPSLASTGQQNGLDLKALLGRSTQEAQPANPLRSTELAQPTVFVLEYALARLLLHWGIVPQALMGYSLGEYVAACISGVLSLHDALRLVVQRARLISQLPAGCMTAVLLSEQEVQPYLSDQIFLAAVNAPQTCVLAGHPPAIAQLEQRLSRDGIVTRRVDATHAFHTPLLEPVGDELRQSVSMLTLKEPQIPYVSNVTGTWVTAAQATDQEYWVRHMCEPVRWQEGVGTLLQGGEQIILEVGAGQTLGSFIRQHELCSQEQMALTFSLLPGQQEKESEQQRLMSTLGKLWLASAQIAWEQVAEHEQRCRVVLPTYPFDRQRYWVEPDTTAHTLRQTLQNPGDGKLAIEHWFYAPGWKRSDAHMLTDIHAEMQQQQQWLVFLDACGIGEALTGQLKTWGQGVVTVTVGQNWSQLGEDAYMINPALNTDYDELFKQLQQAHQVPQHIIHLWNVTTGTSAVENSEDLTTAQDRGFYSILYLTQTLGRFHTQENIHLTLFTNNAYDVVGGDIFYPEKAMLSGLCKVLTREYPHIHCRCIDITLADATSRQHASLIQQCFRELNPSLSDELIAYRGMHRWVQMFEPVELKRPTDQTLRLREKGVYLITGGLGGLGSHIAEYLAKQSQVRLVLVGRSAFPAREQWSRWLTEHDKQDPTSTKIRHLLLMEEYGAELLVLQADITNSEQMQQALIQIHKRFGPISGVFHTAGVPGQGLLQVKTAQIAEEVFAPKIRGTLLLQKLLRNEPLDFMLFYSSITSILGGFGEGDYAAANAFLDAFAHYNTTYHAVPTFSVNWGPWEWDAWQEAIFASAPEMYKKIQQLRAQYGITFQEGEEVLPRILAAELPQLVVLPQGIQKARQQSQSIAESIMVPEQKPSSETRYPRPALWNPYVPPTTEIEQAIANLWEEFLGIEGIGIHDNFFALGGHSLLGTQIILRIRQPFNINLPMAALFESPTVAELAVMVELALIEEIEHLDELHV